MLIWVVVDIVGVIQIRICYREYPRDGRDTARSSILLAGQYFNFGLVSAVKNVLKLLSKQNSWFWLDLYTKANGTKRINLLPSWG
jgi:hypothetical protein